MGIHPTAIVDPGAKLGAGCEVGPYAVVGAGVELGEGTQLLPHAVVLGPCKLGKGNVLHSFSVVGGSLQSKREADRGTSMLLIGDRNVVREHATIHRGSGDGVTRVGSDNWLMVGSHVAHDAVVGSHVIVANGVQIAGHVVVGDYVTFGGMSGVAQFVRIGESAFVAAGAMCERDVPPFVIVQGDRAKVRALNRVGLERREVPRESIDALHKAFRVLFTRDVTMKKALAAVERGDAYVERLFAALHEPPLPRR